MVHEHDGEAAVMLLDKVYLFAGGTPLLDGVRLAVPRGAVVGLVGRNGAGKSTLLRTLVGLQVPGSGQASLLGAPALDLPDAVREQLGYVAQTPDLFDWLVVEEHLALVGRAYARWSQRRALELALLLELPLRQSVRALSNGDQQKLAVVLALAHDPDLLVLDEPVSALDPVTRNQFMRALFSEQRADDKGERSIIISSHLLTDLERVVTHVAFMRKGRLQLMDSWDAMLEHYRLLRPLPAHVPAQALVCQSADGARAVVDTRLAPALADAGRALSLTELFEELNA